MLYQFGFSLAAKRTTIQSAASCEKWRYCVLVQKVKALLFIVLLAVLPRWYCCSRHILPQVRDRSLPGQHKCGNRLFGLSSFVVPHIVFGGLGEITRNQTRQALVTTLDNGVKFDVVIIEVFTGTIAFISYRVRRYYPEYSSNQTFYVTIWDCRAVLLCGLGGYFD
jgi:hypothetical protein